MENNKEYNPNGYNAPKNIGVKSHFHDIKRVPRKLKKKWKHIFSSRYKHLTIGQKCWYILSMENPEYHRFLINEISGHNETLRNNH